jgi:transposase-like protein
VGVFESLHFSTKGVREKSQSWKELLLDLKRRVLAVRPELAVADGALGFWQAIEEVWPKTRGQRCWVHKTVNVLNKLPKSQQSKAKRALQEIWMAETKKDALVAFDALVENTTRRSMARLAEENLRSQYWPGLVWTPGALPSMPERPATAPNVRAPPPMTPPVS